MKYVLTVYLVGNTEPAILECENGECDEMFQQIRTQGLTVKHGKRMDYYPPERIVRIRAIPKRSR